MVYLLHKIKIYYKHELKTDIKDLELKISAQKVALRQEISSSKWQVLSGMALLLFVQLTGKHLGLF
jgi:hypothetical protein